MTIQECYQKLGGNYAQLEKRIPSEKLVRRFVAMFLDDGSYAQLCSAMQEGDRAQALRAVHTLKGVCGNLSLDGLYSASSRLTELLRPEADSIPEGADDLFEEVRQNYELAADTIRAYLGQNEAAK